MGIDWSSPDLVFGDNPHPADAKPASGNLFQRILHGVAGYADKAETAAGREFLHQMNPVAMGTSLGKLVESYGQHPIDTLNNLTGIPQAIDGIRTIIHDPKSLLRPISPEETGSTVGQGAALGAQAAMIGAAKPPGAPPAAARWLQNSAEQNYYDTLAPPAARDVPRAEKVAKGMAERKMTATSAKDLQNQAQAIKDTEGPKVTQAYTAPQPGIVPQAQAGASGPPPMLQHSGKMEIFQDLEKLRNKLATVKRTGQVWEPGLNDYINELKSRLTSMQDPATGEIPQEDLRDVRGILGNKQTAPGGRFKPGDELAPESKSAIDDALRVSIAKTLHRANNVGETVDAQFNFGSELHDFTEANRRATKVANSKGGMAFGQNWLQSLTASKPLRIPREIIGFMNSVPWNTYSGATKMKVADAITKGNWGQVTRQLQMLKLGIPIDQDNNGKTD